MLNLALPFQIRDPQQVNEQKEDRKPKKENVRKKTKQIEIVEIGVVVFLLGSRGYNPAKCFMCIENVEIIEIKYVFLVGIA